MTHIATMIVTIAAFVIFCMLVLIYRLVREERNYDKAFSMYMDGKIEEAERLCPGIRRVFEGENDLGI